MEKAVSYEHTFTKAEIERILANHIHDKLMKQDIDYKDAVMVSSQDFTYNFSDNIVTIDMVMVINADLRDPNHPKKKRK